jgi:hypothetical protein
MAMARIQFNAVNPIRCVESKRAIREVNTYSGHQNLCGCAQTEWRSTPVFWTHSLLATDTGNTSVPRGKSPPLPIHYIALVVGSWGNFETDEESRIWRRGRDSNPRYRRPVCRISSPVHSTTLPPLLVQSSVHYNDLSSDWALALE